MHSHFSLLPVVVFFLLACLPHNILSQTPGEPCYGNVAYCIEGSPIILRCEGSSLQPGNCDDNLNEPPLGALCTDKPVHAGNAVCSAVGSPFPGFPIPTGGLGYPNTSTASANSTRSPKTTSVSGTAGFFTTKISAGSKITKTVYGTTVLSTGLQKATGTVSVGSGNKTNPSFSPSPIPIPFKGVAAPVGAVAVEAVVLLVGAGVLLNL